MKSVNGKVFAVVAVVFSAVFTATAGVAALGLSIAASEPFSAAVDVFAPVDTFKPGSVILFIGDSITHGGRKRDMNHYLGHGYQAEIASRFLGYRHNQKLCFLNRGISGDTTVKLLKRWNSDALNVKASAKGWKAAFPNRPGPFSPDIISLLVGINDYHDSKRNGGITLKAYAANLEEIVSYTLKANPKTEMVLCGPFTTVKSDRNELIAWRKATKTVAERHGLCFIDFQELFDDLVKEKPSTGYWFWDNAHPTYAAHIRMADFWIAKYRSFHARNGK